MTKLTISIYRFFKGHKGVFYTIMLATAAVFALFASKIDFEEDISKLLPSAGDGGAEELVFSDLKVKDKIFIQFTAREGLAEAPGPEELIAIGDEFVANLIDGDTTYNAIGNILSYIDESLMQDGIAFLYENAPAYIDARHYKAIEALLSPDSIDSRMEENYATLRSAAGSAFVGVITRDPIGLRNVLLPDAAGAAGGGMGGNYTMYDGHIFSPDTTVLIAFLSPNFKSFDSKQGTRLSEMIEHQIANFAESNPETEILYHGAPVQSVYNSRQIKKDLLLTISASLILILALLIVCFRKKSSILFLLLPVIYGVLFALAAMYIIKGSMSLMAMGIGAIVMGVAFSYCMHMITHFKYVSNPIKVLKDQTVPVILGSLTTIGAFMGLVLTKSELLQDFGLFASLGLVGTTVFCLLFLPQFFNPRNNKKSEKAFAILEKINSFPFERQRWLIVLILVVSAVCYVMSSRVQFDADLRNIGYDDPTVVRSRNLLAAKTTGDKSNVFFAAVAEDLDSALIYSASLHARLEKLKTEGMIEGYSPTSSLFITTGEQQDRIQLWGDFWTQDRKAALRRNIEAAASKYKFSPGTFTPFFDMLDAGYEPVSLYDSGVVPEELLSNIIEHTDGRYLVFTPVRMDKAQLMEVGAEVVAGHPELVVVDAMYYTSDMVRMIHNDFDLTLTISSLFVLLVLLVSYRSIVLALLAFLPMGLSWYIVLGTMAIFGLQFNLINIVISAFIFGIGVDYSIFIMDGLLANYRTREPRLMYHKTAIFFSAVILIVVVSSLLFAVHPAISSIGISTLIGMTATILIAYSLQPFLFNLLITNRIAKGKPPVSILSLFWGKKGTAGRDLKDNYVYKGRAVVQTLGKELRVTDDYSLIAEAVRDKKSMLDFACGWGFCSYRAMMANRELAITGFDTDSEMIALAGNCYRKTGSMYFTTSPAVMQQQYEVIVIDGARSTTGQALLESLIPGADIVIVRKEILSKYAGILEEAGMVKNKEDGIFVALSKE